VTYSGPLESTQMPVGQVMPLVIVLDGDFLPEAYTTTFDVSDV
jgi:hypothetical protein